MEHNEIIEKVKNEYVCLGKTWEALNNKDYYRRGNDLIIGLKTPLFPSRVYSFFNSNEK